MQSFAYLVQGFKFWIRCTEAVLECVRNLQQRLDNDKAHLLDQLEQICSAMIHTSGLLRVTDVIKDLHCGVVTIVTMLYD